TFTPKGNEIVYVTWTDEGMGAIKRVGLNGRNPVTLTKEKSIYRNPSVSSDGTKIVFVKESGNTDQGQTFTKEPGIYLMDASGENQKKLIREGDFPSF